LQANRAAAEEAMTFPPNTNPQFVAWYETQAQPVKNDIDAKWDVTATDERLFPGHKSAEYARLAFLIEYCKAEYDYA
jgi:hypothetical protein